MKITGLGGALLALFITGCNATKFDTVKGNGSQKSSSSLSSSEDAVTRDPASDPAIGAACNTELKNRGLKFKGGVWHKRVNVPCGYAGVGYVEADVEISAASGLVCGSLNEVDDFLANGDPQNILAQRFAQEDRLGPHSPTQTAAHFRWREVKRRCAQSARCHGTKSPGMALGRMAWLKKCENSVPEFKGFLDALRRLENCNVQNNNGHAALDKQLLGAQCLFTGEGISFFPVVKLNHSATDNAPSPSLGSAQRLSRIDDLAVLAAQIADPCPAPAEVQPIDTLCTAGCYRADQRLLTSASGKYEGILDAIKAGTKDIAVLSRASTLESPLYENVKAARFVASLEDAKEKLLTFSTASGANLTVTENHPLVDGKGFMREASSFKTGESLVKADGARDEIIGIGKEDFFGKVYNVAPVSIAPEDNLVVSEGLINGSHNYQTVLRSELNRQILRSNLAKGF